MKTNPSEIEVLTDESYNARTHRQRCHEAVSEGLEIFVPNEHQLTFDLDSLEDLQQFLVKYEMLEKKAFQPDLEITQSRHGHYHAVVTCPSHISFTELERIALQAIFGSDWKREMFGYLRYQNKQIADVSILFRMKNTNSMTEEMMHAIKYKDYEICPPFPRKNEPFAGMTVIEVDDDIPY